jgi:chromosome segregation ATPase
MRALLIFVLSNCAVFSPALAQSYRTSAEARQAASDAQRELQATQDRFAEVGREYNDVRSELAREAQRLTDDLAAIATARRDATSAYDRRVAELREEANSLNTSYAEQRDDCASEEAALRREQSEADDDCGALRELRLGLYCDQCWRTKTEIEKQEHVPFAQHLKNVNGQPVAAPPEKIAEKEQKCDDKNSQLQEKIDQQAKRCDELRTQYESRFRVLQRQLDDELERHKQALTEIDGRERDARQRSQDAIAALRKREETLLSEWADLQSPMWSLRYRESNAASQAVVLERMEEWLARLEEDRLRQQERARALGHLLTRTVAERNCWPVRNSAGILDYCYPSGPFSSGDQLESTFYIQLTNRTDRHVKAWCEITPPLTRGSGDAKRILRIFELEPYQVTPEFAFELYSFATPG